MFPSNLEEKLNYLKDNKNNTYLGLRAIQN